MKVTAKLMTCVLTTTTLVTLINAYVAIKSDASKFQADAQSEAEQIASAIEGLFFADVWQESGFEEVWQQLRDHQMRDREGTHYDLSMKWVWFDRPSDFRYRPRAPRSELPRLIPRRAVSIRVRDTSGERLHTYWPLNIDDRLGGLEFTRSMEALAEQRRKTMLRTAGLMGSIVAGGGITMWLSGVVFVGQPLRKLIQKSRRIARGDLTGPADVHRNDEMGELATSLNEMCRQLESSRRQLKSEAEAKITALEQLRHADRLRTLGRLASGIAHELGTPLNVASGRAEMIADGKLSPPEVQASAKAIHHETRRMAELIQRLLDFARRKTPHKTRADLTKLVSATTELLSSLAKKSGVELVVETTAEPCAVDVDAAQMQQVFTNVIMNAIQAMPQGGPVTVSISQVPAAGKDPSENETVKFACVSVTDRGTGISAEHMEQLFEPFFTTKEPGEGTGLGLSIAQRIVEEHDGRIRVQSEPDIGTTFSVLIPCGEAP